LREIILFAALALSGCHGPRDAAAERADLNASVAKVPGPTTVTVTQLAHTESTNSGQPLKLPKGAVEMDAIAVDIPAGQSLPIHQHPWSRFFYVERGTLRVTNHDTGKSMDFRAGEAGAEAVGQWHEGRAIGDGPVRVIAIDLVPPGAKTTIMQSPAAAAH
jgi:quercetin dioxygenase-like cupin family protein